MSNSMPKSGRSQHLLSVRMKKLISLVELGGCYLNSFKSGQRPQISLASLECDAYVCSYLMSTRIFILIMNKIFYELQKS